LSTTPFDFDGKVAVVTGAAQGIGVEISRELASGGATVVVGDVQEETGRETADRLKDETGGLVEFHKLDVADSSAVSTTADAVVEAHGRVDVLVNNAGVAESSAALDLDDATWQKIVGINLTGTFLCAREFGRRMVGTGEGGAIVNVSSIAGFKAVRPEQHLAYDVTKAGVAQMARVLAAEWASHQIRVNAIAPGYTETQILRDVGQSDPGTLESWLDQIPQHRLIQPPEIARVVAFLASDSASAITGHVLFADAGFSVW
jgi:NAD(P)-dependent dehydrogenase (short-subunit alcohol dehydrogenase family)